MLYCLLWIHNMLAAEGHVVTIEVKFLSHCGTRTIIPAKKNRRRLSIAYR